MPLKIHDLLFVNRLCQVNRKEKWFNLMLIAHTQKCIVIPKKKAGESKGFFLPFDATKEGWSPATHTPPASSLHDGRYVKVLFCFGGIGGYGTLRFPIKIKISMSATDEIHQSPWRFSQVGERVNLEADCMGKAEKCETLENLGGKILENGRESSLGNLLVSKAHILDLVKKELEGFCSR